ncbi:hypothetical protein IE077_000078 [Cardiosporidium cionae]|uniref:Uncharacterized protein n=1 Tax=Cardiosporidium cionae TaxID=476202 RepID=A0ABQ7J3W4_9APIC|nr:hypothetical protein IE077_000078 [Cardiosporidium cionae]|eukprot:KAF8817690.1 hypothetical protein IE077_000078 [Cardiosporidium cionae]
MAILEGLRLRRHRQSLDWQKEGFCSTRCLNHCAKSPWRCVCAWRAVGIYKHFINMDGLFVSYKGAVTTKKPLFGVPRFVAKQNGYNSVPLWWNPLTKSFAYFTPSISFDKRFEQADRHHFIRRFDTIKGISEQKIDTVLTESDISESDDEAMF